MKRLIKTYETTACGGVDEALYLAALNVEEAMLTAGGRPGIDYTFIDVFTLATKLAPAMWTDIGDMDRTNGLAFEHPRSSDSSNPIFEQSIASIGLPARALNQLRHEGIDTVHQLCKLTPRELRGMPNVGKGTFTQVERCLAEHGLDLGRIY